MRVAIGSDDAGFPLKEVIRAYLQERGVEMRDFGVSSAAPSDIDYPDVARGSRGRGERTGGARHPRLRDWHRDGDDSRQDTGRACGPGP